MSRVNHALIVANAPSEARAVSVVTVQNAHRVRLTLLQQSSCQQAKALWSLHRQKARMPTRQWHNRKSAQIVRRVANVVRVVATVITAATTAATIAVKLARIAANERIAVKLDAKTLWLTAVWWRLKLRHPQSSLPWPSTHP